MLKQKQTVHKGQKPMFFFKGLIFELSMRK